MWFKAVLDVVLHDFIEAEEHWASSHNITSDISTHQHDGPSVHKLLS